MKQVKQDEKEAQMLKQDEKEAQIFDFPVKVCQVQRDRYHHESRL